MPPLPSSKRVRTPKNTKHNDTFSTTNFNLTKQHSHGNSTEVSFDKTRNVARAKKHKISSFFDQFIKKSGGEPDQTGSKSQSVDKEQNENNPVSASVAPPQASKLDPDVGILAESELADSPECFDDIILEKVGDLSEQKARHLQRWVYSDSCDFDSYTNSGTRCDLYGTNYCGRDNNLPDGYCYDVVLENIYNRKGKLKKLGVCYWFTSQYPQIPPYSYTEPVYEFCQRSNNNEFNKCEAYLDGKQCYNCTVVSLNGGETYCYNFDCRNTCMGSIINTCEGQVHFESVENCFPKTDAPSSSPSTSPPTITPSPTDSPTPAPTKRPTRSPTPSPTTSRPTSTPTTSRPTLLPSDAPSSHPSGLPSTKPSALPSFQPSRTPSAYPTPTHSSGPTTAPSAHPTTSPSSSPQPSASPSTAPTMTPTTLAPTASPSTRPSGTPSSAPSVSPTLTLQSELVEVVMSMEPWNDKQILAGDAIILWEATTADRIYDHIGGNEEGIQPSLFDLQVGTNIVRQDLEESDGDRRMLVAPLGLRQLQEDTVVMGEDVPNDPALIIQFDVVVLFRSESKDQEVPSFVYGAFDEEQDRQQYIQTLQSRSRTFDGINKVQIRVRGFDPPSPTERGAGEDDDGLGLPFIIGASLGAAAILFLIALAIMIFRKQNGQQRSFSSTPRIEPQRKSHVVSDLQSDIHVEPHDDISTLGDPMVGTVVSHEVEDLTASVGDVYSYAKEFKRNQQSSVSSRAGRRNGTSIATDDASFEEQFYEEEHRFEVVAPPGKLEMVIDTPQGENPVVHFIKDTSVLAGQIQVGDRLIALDGVDCRTMSAMQCSKLISLKSERARREFIFARPGGSKLVE